MAETQSRPSLSHLDPDVRLCVDVEELLGATWRGEELWRDRRVLVLADANGAYPTVLLPDYPNDPAAWGALMERELSGWRQVDILGAKLNVCRYPKRDGLSYAEGPPMNSLGRAVCLAVLAKHGRDTTPYTQGGA
ncbi:hypothetical protein [Longimicrobium sp.]|jgi:hypothetical protein|uniref:hypothetical protein n=1 Tax=Longimicrobium sp. TaxID=2029185 RepID=UPI002F9259D5